MMTLIAMTKISGRRAMSNDLKQHRWQQLLLVVLVASCSLSLGSSHQPLPSVSFVHKHSLPARLDFLLQLRGGVYSEELPEEQSADEEEENADQDTNGQAQNPEVEHEADESKDGDSIPKPAATEVELVMEMDEDEGSATPVEETDAQADSSPSSSEPLPTETVWSSGGGGGVDDEVDTTSDVSPPPPEQTTFTTEAVMDDPTIDENDSSAFVDRMELADDEGETTEVESEGTAVPVLSGGEASTPTTTFEAPTESEAPLLGTEITKDMEKILVNELRYTKSEVAAMKPNHARVAVQKRLWRPWEGMPPSWYKTGGKPTEAGGGVPKILPKIAVPVIVGAVVVRSSLKGDLHLSDRLASIKKRFIPAKIEKSSTSPSEDEEQEASSTNEVPHIVSSIPSLPASDPLPVNEHVNAPGEPHAHSIKPGDAHPSNDDELDVTWLDKGITAVERKLKSMFSGNK